MNTNEAYRKLRIFIACPSDLDEERERLSRVVAEDLRLIADNLGLTLELLDWRDALPGAGRPEGVILAQLRPKTWDIFVGLMWHRFGTPSSGIDPRTGKPYKSGTEEEFKLAYRLWKKYERPRVMFYWCKRAVSPDLVDSDQLKRVKKFFAGFAPDADNPGLYNLFDEAEQFERLVRIHLVRLLFENAPSGTRYSARRAYLSRRGRK